jgi:Holliday junction resolvasome RuvABC ATP-dependent DNA helicase subunit
VQGQSLTDLHDLLTQIGGVLENTEGELMDVGDECISHHCEIPPMVIFIDEVHTLKDKVVQGLLKATEPKDRILVTEKGSVADCRHIFWVIATTQRGLLDKAYDTRFVQITLNPYTRAEIAKIVHINFPKWDESLCELVTKYGGNIPRSVLLFAEDVQRAIVMEGQDNLSALVKEIARQHQIDQFGMPYQTLNILKALRGGPVSKGRMMYIAGVQLAELENFIMPPLLNVSPDEDSPLVAVESRGYVLTDAGEDELQKRKWYDE